MKNLGLHIIADFKGCPKSKLSLTAKKLETLVVGIVARENLTIVGTKFHQFEPQGVTGMVLLKLSPNTSSSRAHFIK